MKHSMRPPLEKRRRWLALLCVLALLLSALPARAEEVGGDTVEKWNWETFFDYASCGLAAAAAIPSGGTLILVAAVTCGRTLVVHFSD